MDERATLPLVTRAAPMRPDFHGHPGPSDRLVRDAANGALAAAEQNEPIEPPKSLPRHNYALDKPKVRKIADDRDTSLEEQRLNAELDWEVMSAQLEVYKGLPSEDMTEADMTFAVDQERRARLRVLSLDAAIERLRKRKR